MHVMYNYIIVIHVHRVSNNDTLSFGNIFVNLGDTAKPNISLDM